MKPADDGTQAGIGSPADRRLGGDAGRMRRDDSGFVIAALAAIAASVAAPRRPAT
jgi:hypothetical protein